MLRLGNPKRNLNDGATDPHRMGCLAILYILTQMLYIGVQWAMLRRLLRY